MITQAKRENYYEEFFSKSLMRSNQPKWLKRLRREAFDYFAVNGFPTVEDEEWRYTSTAPIARERFKSVNESKQPGSFEKFVFSESQESLIVFYNGRFLPQSSNLSALRKINVFSFTEALHDPKLHQLLEENLCKQVDYHKNGFTALNTAFIDEGLILHIPAGLNLDKPVQLLFLSDHEAASFPRVLIVAEEACQATLIESYLRSAENKYFTNSIVEIVLSDAANLKHYRVQRESHEAFHITTTGAELNRDSVYDSTNITFGAKWSRHDIGVSFNRQGGQAFVDGLYMISKSQHADTHSVIDHRISNCTSRQNYKGIVDGKARAVFNGKVFVRENASGTDAYQSNKNLLLSNEARVDTKPQLEIFNDDVRCSHGATVGQLGDEEIFYLLSRGLNPTLARNLLTYGFAEEIINKITVEFVKAMLDEALLNRLSAKL